MNWYKKAQLNYELSKNIDISSLGSCMLVAELIVRDLLNKGIDNFPIVEGYISFEASSEDQGQEEGITHTWIESNGKIYDPTKEQFRKWGFDPYNIIYEKIKRRYTPYEYLDLCKKFPERNLKHYKV